MTDPAVEAARRAGAANGDWPWDSTSDAMKEAAREALKPIRELHQSIVVETPDDRWLACQACGQDWPCGTAKLAYTTEELEQ